MNRRPVFYRLSFLALLLGLSLVGSVQAAPPPAREHPPRRAPSPLTGSTNSPPGCARFRWGPCSASAWSTLPPRLPCPPGPASPIRS